MQIFEIRIFGNVSGFSEMKLGTGNHLMDGSTIAMIDYENIQTDAFSIAYAPEYYVLSYHFTFPHSVSSKFRSQRASASIVIRRGFKLISPLETLKRIKASLVEYANSMKGNFPQLLASEAKDLYAIVESEITTAPEQAMLNWSADGAVSRAIVAFDEEGQLSKMLESPFRKEFRLDSGHGVILLVYRKQASSLWPQLKDRFKAIKIENYDAVDQIEVEFPDGHRMFVDTRNSEIDYILYKNYYKSYHFKGSLSEKMNEWKVRVIGNRYIIGIALEPEVREYQVRFVDAWTGDDCNPNSVKFIPGKYDVKRHVLRLMGEENNKPVHVQVNENFHVVDMRRSDNKIIVKLEKLYSYSTECIWDSLTKQGINISAFYIEDVKGKKRFRVDKPETFYFPLPYERACILFPETETTLETKCKFEVNPQNVYILQKKHFSDIVFVLPSEIQDRFNEREKHVTLKYRFGKGKPDSKERFNEVIINHSPYKLEFIPDGIFHYICETKGYKKIEGEVELSPQTTSFEIRLTFKPILLLRVVCFLKKNRYILLSFLVGLIVGIFVGWVAYSKTHHLVFQYGSPRYNDELLIISPSDRKPISDSTLQQSDDSLTKDEPDTTASIDEENMSTYGSKEVNERMSRHSETLKKILHMSNKEKYMIKEKGSYVYRHCYEKLSSQERKELDKVINHPAFPTVSIPENIVTIRDALRYLNEEVSIDIKR